MAVDLLNTPNCGGATSTFNSGFALCDVIRKEPKALLLIDSGVVFGAAVRISIPAMVAAIKTATRGPRGARVYPIMSLTDFQDQSTQPTKAAVGNLSIQQITMQQGVPAFNFQHRKGDLYHQQLSAAENANLKLLIIDSAYVIYGTKTPSGDLTGFTLSEFYAELAKFATAAAPATYPFSVVLDSIIEYKENLGIFQLDATIMNISGNVDVNLNTVATPLIQVTNVAKITPVGRGGKNIGVLYPTALAVVGAWVATNVQTAASVTITSVTWDSVNLRFNVTLDNTAYTALTAGDKVTVDLATPAALLALGVDGFESLGPVTVIK
jgi:hypothetical protein